MASDGSERVLVVLRRLSRKYPGGPTALKHDNPVQLLVAVMLSAQCTDRQVNRVTAKIFKKYCSARDFARAPRRQLEADIRSTGFFRQKTRNIQAACRIIFEEHDGRVPETMRELASLPGVGRKTANIVLTNAFNIVEGIAVDTHVRRLSMRLGFTENNDPVKIEGDLMEAIPKRWWNRVNHLLIVHGRAVCRAQTPACSVCALKDTCPKVGVTKRK